MPRVPGVVVNAGPHFEMNYTYCSYISVFTPPGAMALTVMLLWPQSLAKERVKPSTAALLPAYNAWFGTPVT
jgi:hypothetical protein